MPARSKFRIVAPERDSTRVNERIRVREIRVIGADGEQLGVMSPEDALIVAREDGLDLVEVAANSRPPVCRIMDYGKYKYEQKKKSASKKSHSATLKEVKLRPGTDQHDLNFKLNNARKFLMEGDKVKVTVMFRGREMVHTYRGREQLDEVRKQLGAIAKVESNPRMEGRFMSMILVADREAVAEAKRLAEAETEEQSEESAVVEKVKETNSSADAATAETEGAAAETPTAESEEISPTASD
ncbi:MAG: translation initiation factor IF-3 [Proteobacteria bacterium]|nr:translation initiation factor IF-3 [Pseudomonadota bacterium]